MKNLIKRAVRSAKETAANAYRCVKKNGKTLVVAGGVAGTALLADSACAQTAGAEALPDVGFNVLNWVPPFLTFMGGIVGAVFGGKLVFLGIKKGFKWIRGIA